MSENKLCDHFTLKKKKRGPLTRPLVISAPLVTERGVKVVTQKSFSKYFVKQFFLETKFVTNIIVITILWEQKLCKKKLLTKTSILFKIFTKEQNLFCENNFLNKLLYFFRQFSDNKIETNFFCWDTLKFCEKACCDKKMKSNKFYWKSLYIKKNVIRKNTNDFVTKNFNTFFLEMSLAMDEVYFRQPFAICHFFYSFYLKWPCCNYYLWTTELPTISGIKEHLYLVYLCPGYLTELRILSWTMPHTLINCLLGQWGGVQSKWYQGSKLYLIFLAGAVCKMYCPGLVYKSRAGQGTVVLISRNIIHGTKAAALVTKSHSNHYKESTSLLLKVRQISCNVQSLPKSRVRINIWTEGVRSSPRVRGGAFPAYSAVPESQELGLMMK